MNRKVHHIILSDDGVEIDVPLQNNVNTFFNFVLHFKPVVVNCLNPPSFLSRIINKKTYQQKSYQGCEFYNTKKNTNYLKNENYFNWNQIIWNLYSIKNHHPNSK